jgi:GMP synthase-like glutamine amidotransferase
VKDRLGRRAWDRFADWRRTPGILGRHASSAQSIHTLLGYFLADREAPTPFPGRDRLAHEECFEWGIAAPLEKVIDSDAAFEAILSLPELYRQSVAIVEPSPNVGVNPRGEAVRASKNVAYILQQVADADSILYPVWRSGVGDLRRLASVLSAGLATVVQGGDPSVHDPRTFAGSAAPLEGLLDLVDVLLLQRRAGSGPVLFVCLGHQLAAASLVRLVRRAVATVLGAPALSLDPSGAALASLERACRRIRDVGVGLPVRKGGTTVAQGWEDRRFAVAPNEAVEIGTRRLLPYRRSRASHVPDELHQAHALVADEHDGVIETLIALEREIHIEMFHGDEVNEEAALFANWACRVLHEAIVPIRHELAPSALSWLLRMPYAVEILSQTRVDAASLTEVGTMAIYYKDWETHTIRRSFTCQFHPELMADIRDIGRRPGPRYAELKQNDGARLLVRLLYHGMQE